MTREELFRAVGQVREEQIIEAETPRKARRLRWQRYAALAASLALVLTAAWGFGLLDGMQPMEDFVAGERKDGGMDGSNYSSPDGPAQPIYSSKGVEIGELRNDKNFPEADACLVWLSMEEILSPDRVIFRGIVRNIRYFQVEIGGDDSWYYRVFSVEVLEDIQGGLAAGDIYNVVTGCTSSVSGNIDLLEIGTEAIFLARFATPESGVGVNDDFFSYADLGELYLSEGIRFLFVQSGGSICYDQNTYEIPAEDPDESLIIEGSTNFFGSPGSLDRVERYLRSMIDTYAHAPSPNSTAP